MKIEDRDQLYLIVISILLGFSMLKIPELFQLGSQLRELFDNLKNKGFSIPPIGVYFFIASYLIFFILISLTAFCLVKKYEDAKSPKYMNADIGALLGLSIITLIVSYLMLFIVIVSGVIDSNTNLN